MLTVSFIESFSPAGTVSFWIDNKIVTEPKRAVKKDCEEAESQGRRTLFKEHIKGVCFSLMQNHDNILKNPVCCKALTWNHPVFELQQTQIK